MPPDIEIYSVLCCHKGGDYFREIDFADATNRETIKRDIRAWQFDDLSRVFCFNPAEGWSRDVSEDIAREINEAQIADGEPTFDLLAKWIEATTGESAFREREAA